MVVTPRIIALAIVCTLALNACGHKGKLKSPSQIERAEQKKKDK